MPDTPHMFHPGQRWISESEPELGLGSVLSLSARTVTLAFGASEVTREYSQVNAPLRRVQFLVGDTVKRNDGTTLLVQSVVERAGLTVYVGEGGELCETELSNAIGFSKPHERLLNGHIAPVDVFNLRVAALTHQHHRRKSSVRGFVGGRIDLLPHQLYIASEVAGRLAPRVLLADEVGLGKTIEACLILQRLIQTGRVQRVLILVPDSLVHQWFEELKSRFNLWFHIFDEERCASLQEFDQDINPFLDDQLIIASIRLFTKRETRLTQALAAGWDMIVVDEAHHLGWSPEVVSPEYAVVDALARNTSGLLLLTATPEQLGMASHFARLRLLDPARFHDLNEFMQESDSYRDVARLADKLLGNHPLTKSDVTQLAKILSDTVKHVQARLSQIADGVAGVRDELIGALLDQHGTGRVMFRNTRSTISGFPRRVALLYPLTVAADETDALDKLAAEYATDRKAELRASSRSTDEDAEAPSDQGKFFTKDPLLFDGGAGPTDPPSAGKSARPSSLPYKKFKRVSGVVSFVKDPRLTWLAGLLRKTGQDKILLICRTPAKVVAIDAALRGLITLKQAVFHEELTLVERDRNAAWFGEEDGARLLICSEIGSEGRNFQFAHHLVLLDLPLDPELLEQRIGRLDRIGQTVEIQVHVPYIVKSPQEVLARWYQDGLNAFEKNLHGGRALLEQFGGRIHDLARDFHETQETSRAELERLIEETRVARKVLFRKLEEGRDRLLELNSFRPEAGHNIVETIRGPDADLTLDDFMLVVFEHYGIHAEAMAARTYQLGSSGVFEDAFPGLPSTGMTITFDRIRGVAREDVQFLTWDHPLVTNALDLLLGSEVGNSCIARLPGGKEAGLFIEAIYLLECVAPPALHVDRFLPPTPLRVLVDQQGRDVGTEFSVEQFAQKLLKGDSYDLMESAAMRNELIPMLIEKTEDIAASHVPALIERARAEMKAQLDGEIARLKALATVNKSVRPDEIELLVKHQRELDQHVKHARLRLDAIRLIQREPVR